MQPSWIFGQIENDLLNDKTNAFNPFDVYKRYYTSLNTLGIYPSSWRDYPKKYKIIGYQFSVNDVMLVQTRKTLDILQVFASAGGVLKFISLFIASCVGFFSQPTMPSLMANRLFKW